MGSNVNSSSFAVISIKTILIKMHNWAVSLVSVDLSNWSEKHPQSAMSLRSCCVKFSATTSQRCVTVHLDSWRALIDDDISSLFLKSRNKESAASTKASFIISPSWKDFLCLMIEWLTRNNASVSAFVCQFCCVKNVCCPINCDFSSLTFLFLSLFFQREVSVVHFMNSSKVPLKSTLLRNSNSSLTNQTNAIFFYISAFVEAANLARLSFAVASTFAYAWWPMTHDAWPVQEEISDWLSCTIRWHRCDLF